SSRGMTTVLKSRSDTPLPGAGGASRALWRLQVAIMGASLYQPINVYKSVAPDIGIVDGPFEYLTIAGVRLPLPFTTRMTVVRLMNGELFLHSPIKFDNRLANELQGLGTPRHLVSPNRLIRVLHLV